MLPVYLILDTKYYARLIGAASISHTRYLATRYYVHLRNTPYYIPETHQNSFRKERRDKREEGSLGLSCVLFAGESTTLCPEDRHDGVTLNARVFYDEPCAKTSGILLAKHPVY